MQRAALCFPRTSTSVADLVDSICPTARQLSRDKSTCKDTYGTSPRARASNATLTGARKHTGERPFSCGCGRTFTRLDNLRQHAQTVHSGTEMARISDEQNAIAAATKMRPTPNSPPPRVDGASDTDPYPRPIVKTAIIRSRATTREPSAEIMAPTPPQQAPPVVAQATPVVSQPELAIPTNPYESMSFMPSALDNPVDSSAYHTSAQSYQTFRNAMPSYVPNNYHHQHHHHSSVQHHHHPDVESSVGSQPISSLVKRRAPKNDFVYTGGHMMNSPGTVHSGATEFDFARTTSDTTPDEGEQMSEYINNGLEPRLARDRSVSVTDKGLVGPVGGGGTPGAGGGSGGLEAMTLLSELAAARRD